MKKNSKNKKFVGSNEENFVQRKRKAQSFAKGAFIITAGMMSVKILGGLFKIPLANILGGEGNGYFNTAYSLYNPIYALASAGFPVAVSRMIAKAVGQNRFKDIKKIHAVSVPIFTIMAVLGFIFMLFSAFAYAHLAKAPDAVHSMFMLAPTLFFSCLISIYKGYYQGLQNMTPTAISEVIEAVGKVIFGLSFAFFTVKFLTAEYQRSETVLGKFYETENLANGAILPYASAAAVLGISVAAVAGYIYIFLTHKLSGELITNDEIENSPPAKSTKKIVMELLKIASPIGLGAIIMNLAGVIDSILIQRRLFDIMQNCPQSLINAYSGLIPQNVIDRGTTHIFLSGCFGYMSAIIMILPAISQGLAISSLPMTTKAWVKGAKKLLKSKLESVLQITAVIATPAGLGLCFFSHPIMDLIYNTFGNSKHSNEIYISAQIMVVFAIAVIFTTTSAPLCSLLQAIGRADLPLKILFLGVVLKAVLNYILVGIPKINIQGAGIGTLVCYLLICVTLFYYLCKKTKINLNYVKIFLKPFVCSLISVISAYLFNIIFSNVNYKFATIFSILIAVGVYLYFLNFTKTISLQKIIKKFVKINNFSKKT